MSMLSNIQTNCRIQHKATELKHNLSVSMHIVKIKMESCLTFWLVLS